MIEPVSSLSLASKHRVSQIQFHSAQPYFAVQSHDRSVEIFRVRTEEEVRKKQARRKKRLEEKKRQEQTKAGGSKSKAEDDENVATMENDIVDFITPHLVVRASGKIRSFDFGSNQSSSKGIAQVSGTQLTISVST